MSSGRATVMTPVDDRRSSERAIVLAPADHDPLSIDEPFSSTVNAPLNDDSRRTIEAPTSHQANLLVDQNRAVRRTVLRRPTTTTTIIWTETGRLSSLEKATREVKVEDRLVPDRDLLFRMFAQAPVQLGIVECM